MNASELHRKLLYCGYDDLTDYLRNSPLNRYIYKQLLELKYAGELSLPIITVFNEVYYQCVKMQNDFTPGEDVVNRYLEEGCRWLNSKDTNDLVFCIVWALIRLKGSLTFAEECFVRHLISVIHDFKYVRLTEQIVADMQKQGVKVPSQFPPMPAPVNELPPTIETDLASSAFVDSFLYSLMGKPKAISSSFHKSWKEITNNFSHTIIDWYVSLYKAQEDQLALLLRIQKACNADGQLQHKEYFHHAIEKITNGGKTPAKTKYTVVWMPPVDKSDGMNYTVLTSKEEQSASEKTEVSKSTADTAELLPSQPSLTIAEMAAHVKARFSKSAAEEFCAMLYKLSLAHNYLDESNFRLIDGIVPAILERDKPHQTFDMPNVHQFNNNPQTVINQKERNDEDRN